MINSKLNTRRKWGYLVALLVVVVVISSLVLPQFERLHAHGPSNIGHEKLKCKACHKQQSGTLRQRIQQNVQYLFGFQNNAVAFGLKPVANNNCIYCHERPNDRHPVYRFFEPKYIKIQKTIQPQFCISCHLEHTGKRVTSEMVFCKNCHEQLKIKNDPINRSHQKIVEDELWQSCLGCHDYHGNHKMKVNTKFEQRITRNNILHYFKSDSSPYSKNKFHKVPQDKLGG